MGIPYAEVIGDPIAHSKSPLIHRYWLETMGLEGDYRAARVTAVELPDYLERRRADPDWRGCSVTIPHKERIVPLLDVVNDDGIGAINCVCPRAGRLEGRNTDAGAIGEVLTDPIDTAFPVCLIGAGGAARAAIAILDVYAVHQFNIVVRDPPRGEALLAGFGKEGRVFTFDQAEQALDGSAGVINASPLGMKGCAPMPDTVLRGVTGIRRDGFAVDLVYTPLRTALLDVAAMAGLVTRDGLSVLIAQAAEAFRLFFEAEVPRDDDLALRALLAR